MTFKLIKNLIATALLLLAAQANAAVVYQTSFPNGFFGGPCSPCGAGRVYDRVSLGAATSLGRIEFAVHDITDGGIQDVNISIFNNNEAQLYSSNFSGASLQKSDYLPGTNNTNYTIGIDLPSWAVGDEYLWVSIFGINGSSFGLSANATGGDGVARHMASTMPEDFILSARTLTDVSMRLYSAEAAAEVPEPASLALLGLGLMGIGAMRRRKA